MVIDASSLIKYLFKERNWLKIEEQLLKEEVHTIDHATKELLNALWKSTTLYKIFTEDIAIEKWKLFKKLIGEKVIILENQEELLEEALQIALSHQITAYDALYLAQANKLKAPLLTSDQKQANAAKKMNINTIFIE
ncbi:MAG: PIN domain nuclease [Candidatus Methanomethylicota archaeon]|uniref:PIN domain nuclease n=1 Tax=Thermoproteota archaeon TaxID=2056631 RepID=A0A497ELT2_9CREN|nr:MAG: PIN domain nuclease [Candidatus Verstraetearchaeota archaeon]